jgi:hypothetical protein
MARWQTYGVHPVTALLLAGSAFTTLHRFPVLDFPGAPYATAAVVLVSVLLLSRKYDPSLSAIFLGLALFTAYKIANHKPQRINQEQPEYTAAKTLAVAIAEVHNASDVPDLKTILKNLPLTKPVIPCEAAECDDQNPAAFKVRFANDNNDKIWYMNDRFELFERGENGQFRPQPY